MKSVVAITIFAFAVCCLPFYANSQTVTQFPNFCSGSTIDISTAINQPLRTFKWTLGTASTSVTGQQASNILSSAISQKLTLSGTTNGTVNYNVTDDLGAKYTITVTVLPLPNISNLTTGTGNWNSMSIGCGNNINFTAAATILIDKWNWSRPAVLGQTALNGTSNLINDNLFDTTSNAVSIPYTVNMSATNGCSNQQILTYNISPTPFISDPIVYDTICSGAPITFIPKTQIAGTIYTWANPATTGITNASSAVITSKINSFNQTLTNTTANTISTAYNIIPNFLYTNFTCTGPTFQKFIVVNPKPNISSPVNVTVCSGTPFKTTPTTGGANIVPASTQYTWTIPQYSDTSLSGGSGLQQTPATLYADPPISQTLVNKSILPQTATYNVFAKAGSCSSIPFDLIVTVNPLPIITSKDSLVVCSGTPPTYQPSGSIPSGTLYSWIAPQVTPANTLTGSGINAQNNQLFFAPTLTNSNTNPAAANFTVIPSSAGCLGKAFQIVVTVNPSANLSINNASQSLVTCSGSPFVASPVNVPPNTLYSWKTPSMGSGLSTSGFSQNTNLGGDSTITGLLNYNGVDSGGIATYTVVPKSGNCTGAPFKLIVTVRPLPVVATASQSVCSDNAFTTIPTSNLVNIATYYTWDLPLLSPLNTITGATANGSPMPSISQQLINANNTVAQATYTVKPTALGCAGKPFTFIAAVNPTPNFSNKDTIICPGVPFVMNPSPLPFITNYTWESPIFNIQNSVIGGQPQAIPFPNFSQLLTNTTNSIDVLATYKVTPRFGDCIGKPFSIVVTVKASPYITDTLVSTVCSGSAFTVKLPNNLPVGSMFTWDDPTYSNAVTGGFAQNVLQTNISQVLKNINSDTSSGRAFYSVTPVANGCKGISFPVKVTVKANSAVLTSPLVLPDQCSGTTFNYSPQSNFAGTAFSWTRDSIPGLANLPATGYSDINEILTDSSGEPVRVNYRFTLLYNGCVNLKSQVVTVLINPKPELSSPLKPIPICSGNTFNYTPVSKTRDVSFEWSRSYVAGISQVLTNGQNSISEELHNTTFNIVQVPYVYSMKANGCSNQQTVYEIVNPVLTLPDMTTPVCSGSNFNIIPANTVNAEFLWSTPLLDNGLVGGSENRLIPTNAINGSISNLTDTANIATYNIQTIIPGATTGGCIGKPFKLTIVVNPIPVLSSPLNLPAICSNTNFTYSPISKTPGTIFSWTRDSIAGIANKASKGSYAINETLLNSTINPVSVSYKYKTTFNGCTDSSQVVNFIMNPAPIVPDQKLTICSGTNFSLPTNLEPLKTTYTWDLPTQLPNQSLKGYNARKTPQTIVQDSLNNTLTTDAIAIYNIIPQNATCQLKPFNVTVTVKPISLIGNQTTSTCTGQKMQFTPTQIPNGTQFKWKFAETNPSFALSGYTNNDTLYQTAVTQNLLNSGIIPVKASYLVSPITNGCLGLPFSLVTTVNSKPQVNIEGLSSLCENASDTFRLTFTGTSPWSISYRDNKDFQLNQVSGFTSANAIFVQNTLPKTATYDFRILHVNDAFCSNDSSNINPYLAISSQNLKKLPVANIEAPSGQLICVGSYQPLVITPFFQSYQWYFNGQPISNSTSVNYNAYQQGLYSAIITDSIGCTNTTVNVMKMNDLKNFGIYFKNDSINCINALKQFTNYSDTSAVRNIKWNWNFNGEDSAIGYNATKIFKTGGLKKISLSATIPSCAYSIKKDSLIAIAEPRIPVNLQTVSTNAGKSLQLQGRKFEGQAYQYSWQPVWGLDFLNIDNPIFNYTKSQNYYISMTSPEGCITVDTIRVKVFDSAIVNIFVPRSFSPNGDGINDKLYPYLAGMKSLTYFKIVNKFGKLVFESRNSTEGWNGFSSGISQPMDAYNWIAEGIDNNGNVVQKNGSFLLIR
jgi:gliding motility-associated-like protein